MLKTSIGMVLFGAGKLEGFISFIVYLLIVILFPAFITLSSGSVSL